MDSLLAWLLLVAGLLGLFRTVVGGMLATWTAASRCAAAVGGFFIPIIFGHLVPHTSFDTGWVFLAIASFAFALLGLAGRNPAAAPTQGSEVMAPRR